MHCIGDAYFHVVFMRYFKKTKIFITNNLKHVCKIEFIKLK